MQVNVHLRCFDKCCEREKKGVNRENKGGLYKVLGFRKVSSRK